VEPTTIGHRRRGGRYTSGGGGAYQKGELSRDQLGALKGNDRGSSRPEGRQSRIFKWFEDGRNGMNLRLENRSVITHQPSGLRMGKKQRARVDAFL